MSPRLVSDIDGKDFGAETLRIGDLDGDGAPDLLFVQSDYTSRAITCFTAVTVSGRILWQTGTPAAENGRVYSDLPVQIYDWDGDGANEVLWIEQAVYEESIIYDDARQAYRAVSLTEWEQLKHDCVRERARRYSGQATLHILDGSTGREKSFLRIPAPADDSFLFADLTGRGRRADLVVKDRYWNIWGLAHEGAELWHWEGSVGHFPAYGDIDNDGRDEVFVGYALLDHDGKVLFEHPAEGHHQDAAYAVRLSTGEWRLLFGNGGLHCLDTSGKELWHHPLPEAQHVIAGHFRDDSEIQIAVLNRGHAVGSGARAPATLYLYDMAGKEIWRYVGPEGSALAAIVGIRWSGRATQELIMYAGQCGLTRIIDGRGETIEELPAAGPVSHGDANKTSYYCLRADVWGDSRDELIVFGSAGCRIWANTAPLAIPTLYNCTLYQGM